MLYDFLDTIEDNLKRGIDIDISSFKRRVELDCNLIIPNNNVRNKILSSLLLVVAHFNYF